MTCQFSTIGAIVASPYYYRTDWYTNYFSPEHIVKHLEIGAYLAITHGLQNPLVGQKCLKLLILEEYRV
jgi:hypothetical protein